MSHYLIEIDAAIDAAGTIAVQRYGTVGVATGATDVPAHTFYEPRVKRPGVISRQMFSGAATSGQSRVGFGDIELVNVDGDLDALVDYSMDGRALRILASDGTAFATYALVLRATVEQVEFSFRSLSFRLRDRLFELEGPLAKAVYSGANVLPAGVNGGADLKGVLKPRLYGEAFNIAPPIVNTSKLIYQVNDGAITLLPAVYDRGLSLTKGADYASAADVEATAPAAGQFRVHPASGLFRLGSTPAGQITCDAATFATALRSPAQLLKQVALDAGIAAGDIASADVTALDAAAFYVAGAWVFGSDSALSVMDRIAASAGAFYGFDRLGVLRMGQLAAPSGAAAFSLAREDILDIERVRGADATGGIPAYRVTVNYAPNYTVQTSDLAGAVTDARRAIIGRPFLSEVAEDLSVKAKHLQAVEITVNSQGTLQASAATEAARLLALYKVRRDTFRVTVKIDTVGVALLELNAVVSITLTRFGMNSGKLFRILALETDFESGRATLTLWG